MATGRRESRKKSNRYKVIRTQMYFMLFLFLAGTLTGAIVGRITAPKKIETITITETVPIPSYESDKLPEVEYVMFFDVPLSHSLQTYLYEICADENVPVTLALAIIDNESRFNPEVVSGTNDYGLMQINAINHDKLSEEYQCADMLNPYQNVFCGVKIIGALLKEYDSDYAKALMAYNMGQYGAEKAWGNGIYSSDYTVRVLGLWEYYEEVKNNAANVGNE